MSQARKFPTNLYLLSALVGGLVGMALFLPLSAVTGPLVAYASSYAPGKGLTRTTGSFLVVCFCAIPAADLGAVLGVLSGRLGYLLCTRRSAALLAAALGGLTSAFLVSLWMAVYIYQGSGF